MDGRGEPGSDAAARWADARVVAALFAVDPSGLGGVALRGGPGPAREAWLATLARALGSDAPTRRMPAGMDDERLIGGVDLVATLAAGRTVASKGLLAEADGGVVIIPMAERLPAPVAALIGGALDRHEIIIERDGVTARAATRFGIVALDESVGDEERVPAFLMARLAFHIDLAPFAGRGWTIGGAAAEDIAMAREAWRRMEPAPDEIIEALVGTAAAFGIGEVTAPLLALRAARAAAALSGRAGIVAEDAALAARLVLAPRALSLPSTEDAAPPPEPPEPDRQTEQAPDPSELPSLEDILLAAVQAALPEGLLAALKAKAARGADGPRAGGGAPGRSPRRGRPAGSRPGTPRSGARLALVDTLRAAAPWQTLRRAERAAPAGRIEIRRADFRLKHFIKRREATIVFCVDASGSAAFHRLAESKGAVELLLAEAYVARTHAALVVFRGAGAEVLLPPTRSLARARALLADLPGGGGTPLAAGIDAATVVALGERARGREPLIVFLTDGRANVARDARGGRAVAVEEATMAARALALTGLPAVFIDTAPRPREDAAALALAMGARYAALPYVEAGAVRDIVRASAVLSTAG